MGKKHNISFENIYLTGFPLDNCEARTLTLDNICDIQTILVYDYEDGKPWHDYTCVMEIIFFGYHDNIGNDRKILLRCRSYMCCKDKPTRFRWCL